MNRRHFINLLTIFGGLLAGLRVKPAAAQSTPPSGLPLDRGRAAVRSSELVGKRFVAPRQWSGNELPTPMPLDKSATVLREGRREDFAEIGGVRVATATGRIEAGSLDPVVPSVDLPEALSDIILPAEKGLDLVVMNADYNPFRLAPVDPTGKPLVGELTAAAEVYQGKAFLPVREVIAGLLQSAGPIDTQLLPLLPALSELVLVRTAAHQFRIGDEIGNRVVFYSSASPDGSAIGHTAIDRLVHTLASQRMRLAKQMAHFTSESQGGSIEGIVMDGVGGTTHVGGYSAGFGADGSPISVKSDWPSDYGVLNDGNRHYNAHLLAIDYQGGAADTIPNETLAAYCHNADMWDCCAAMIVPFASEDPNPIYTDYTFNPLEVYDQRSARAVAGSLANFEKATFLAEHGAFYCAEGQYVVANLGPQEDTLLKQSRFGQTAFGGLINRFQEAPEYAGLSLAERRKRPLDGWRHLRRLGLSSGGISDEQFEAVERTSRTGVYLEWIPEDVRGWQAYSPTNREALIARPMTIATLVWSLLRRYLPRDRLAAAIAGDISRAHASGEEAVRRAVRLLCNGEDPTSPAGQHVLAAVSVKAATGLLLSILTSEQTKAVVLKQAGFHEITNDEDKLKFLEAYDEFLEVMFNADYSTQASLDRALLEADEKLGDLIVTRRYFNPVTRTLSPAKPLVMKYAAPAAFGAWAQQQFFGDTTCLRYVATAMHVEQAKR